MTEGVGAWSDPTSLRLVTTVRTRNLIPDRPTDLTIGSVEPAQPSVCLTDRVWLSMKIKKVIYIY